MVDGHIPTLVKPAASAIQAVAQRIACPKSAVCATGYDWERQGEISSAAHAVAVQKPKSSWQLVYIEREPLSSPLACTVVDACKGHHGIVLVYRGLGIPIC